VAEELMSTVRLLVLGVVRAHGEAHGYAVHRELMSWRVDTWTAVKPPSIYHAIKQLAREGKLRSTGRRDSPSGPARVSYTLTGDGEDEFFELLQAALLSPDIEEFGAGVAFMQCLRREQVKDLLQQHLSLLRQFGVELQEMKPQWPDPDEPPHAHHLLDLWSGQFDAAARWTSSMMTRIDDGGFRFADD
jgi:DNA-binding PadR family transcriptional regulator